MGPHLPHRRLTVRLQDGHVFNRVVSEKPIGRLGFTPTTTGAGEALRRALRQMPDHLDRAAVPALIVYVDALKFLVCPAHETPAA